MASDNGMRNGLGIASLVLGIVGLPLGAVPLFWVVPVLAIIFGAIGIKRANRGQASNKVMSTWGMWLGIAGVAFGAFIAFGISLSNSA